MSDAGEIQQPNDYVVIKVDIDDSPLVEFPLSELFDIAASTVVEDYLNVIRAYVTQVLDDTTWLDKICRLGLLRTEFGVFYRREDGGIFSMRQPALQRRIAQTLRSRKGSPHSIEVPVLVRFLCPAINLPRNPSSPLAIARGHRATIQQRPLADTMRPLFVDTAAHFLLPAPVLCPTLLVLDDTACHATAVHNGHAFPCAQSSVSGMAPTGVALLHPSLHDCAAPTGVTSSIPASPPVSGIGPLSGTVGADDHHDGFADFDLTFLLHCVTTTSTLNVFALRGYCGGTDVHVPSPGGGHIEHHIATSHHLAHHDAALPPAIDGPSTFASSHRVSLLGVLLRYHPIDRGRRHFLRQ